MKKFLVIFAIAITFMVQLSVVSALDGDVNGDGKVNSKDVDLIQKYALEQTTDEQNSIIEKNGAGDVNGDGYINLRDATEIQTIIDENSTPNVEFEDINEDGFVDSLDIRIMQDYLTAVDNYIKEHGKEPGWHVQPILTDNNYVIANGDVNNDGKIDSNDLDAIKAKVNKNVDSQKSEGKEDASERQEEVTKGQTDLNQTYHNINTKTVSCGDETIKGIPKMIPEVVHIIYLVIQVAVPIVVVILGMIDLIKAVIAGKEDEIKKHQMTFIKRLIAAALVFFVFVIVKLVVSSVADTGNVMSCADCFLNGVDNCVIEK